MKMTLSAMIAAGFVLGAGSAAAHSVRYATVRVIAVEPVYRTVIVETPYRECRTEFVEHRAGGGSVAGQTLAGAIVGAAVGRQFGDGSGRDALTVIGAAAGSAIANQRALQRQTVTVVRQPVERCATRYRQQSRQQITGYWVDYRHRGRHYRIHSRSRPGDHIRIAVRS